MKKALLICGAVFGLCAALNCQAGEFTFEADAPKFKVTIPALPPIQMQPHPLNASHPHLRFLGTEGPYTVSILTPTTDSAMTPARCAAFIMNALPARTMVPASKMRKARIDDNTYVAMYVVRVQKTDIQLHAHFLSASAGGTHCIEVHASKKAEAAGEFEPWSRSFLGTSIDPGNRPVAAAPGPRSAK